MLLIKTYGEGIDSRILPETKQTRRSPGRLSAPKTFPLSHYIGVPPLRLVPSTSGCLAPDSSWGRDSLLYQIKQTRGSPSRLLAHQTSPLFHYFTLLPGLHFLVAFPQPPTRARILCSPRDHTYWKKPRPHRPEEQRGNRNKVKEHPSTKDKLRSRYLDH